MYYWFHYQHAEVKKSKNNKCKKARTEVSAGSLLVVSPAILCYSGLLGLQFKLESGIKLLLFDNAKVRTICEGFSTISLNM